MPKRARAEYMRSYRLRRKLAALKSPDADWRRMHPTAALVELARAFPGEPPMDGDDTIPPASRRPHRGGCPLAQRRPVVRLPVALREHRRNPHARVGPRRSARQH